MDNIYKRILEDTLAGYWDWDIANGTEYLSPTFKSMFGYEDHELPNVPETWQQLILPADLDKVLKNYEEHVASKGDVPYRNEVRYRHKNGSTVWVLCTGSVVEWDAEKPLRMVGCHIDITKQKEAEDELRDIQQLLRQTNETAKVGGWEVDLVANTNTWTKVTYDIHEVTEEHKPTVESGISFYKEGESRNKITEAFTKLVTDGTPFDLELQIITGKGNVKWVRAIGSGVFNNGKCVKAYGIFQDIDEQKRTQLELALSEKRLAEAFEYSAIGMAIVSLEGKWLRVNKQVCEMLGYEEEELKAQTFQDITHPDDLDIDLDHVQELIEGKAENYMMEKRYFHKYGHIVWVLLAVSIIRDDKGKPLHFISQIDDITQRKKVEQDLQKVNEQLTTLYSAMKYVSVIATDLNGTISHYSKGSELLLGYDADEMIGKQTPAIIHVEQEVVARGKELSREFNKEISGFDVFITYAKLGESESREWTYVRKDGSKFPVQLVVSSIESQKGEIIGYLGIATDISDLKETEDKLKETIDIVSEQNKRLFNFAHIVSHNLRSHSGNLEMILDLMNAAKDNDEKSTLLTHLRSISTNLSETISHLNEVVTIQTNIKQQKEDIDLQKYINDALSVLAVDIETTRSSFINEVPERTIIKYNKAYLESILLNLFSNAIKYRDDKRRLKVSIRVDDIAGERILIISDNGLGIDLDRYKEKLFGMYKTFHGNADAKGIGLFITKNQIEAMGGKIEVDSEVNIGTTFKVYL